PDSPWPAHPVAKCLQVRAKIRNQVFQQHLVTDGDLHILRDRSIVALDKVRYIPRQSDPLRCVAAALTVAEFFYADGSQTLKDSGNFERHLYPCELPPEASNPFGYSRV